MKKKRNPIIMILFIGSYGCFELTEKRGRDFYAQFVVKKAGDRNAFLLTKNQFDKIKSLFNSFENSINKGGEQ